MRKKIKLLLILLFNTSLFHVLGEGSIQDHFLIHGTLRNDFNCHSYIQYHVISLLCEWWFIFAVNPQLSGGHQTLIAKRDVASVPVKLVNGAAVIPPANGVQSLALPPLLTLNNNLSQIPVPIPNTSVVRYAKINTVVKSP